MSIPVELKEFTDAFFLARADEFNLSEAEGCGEYIEALVVEAQNRGWSKVGHLKKNPGQTQWNGHAVDAILYDSGELLLRAVDLIANAEAKPPYNTTDNQPPRAYFGIDIPRYKKEYWYLIGEEDELNSVPWVAYNEGGFQRLKKMLKHDYERRPQGPDYDVSVWAGRYFHNCYMGPEGIPLGEDGALRKIKPELCSALRIPVDNYYGG